MLAVTFSLTVNFGDALLKLADHANVKSIGLASMKVVRTVLEAADRLHVLDRLVCVMVTILAVSKIDIGTPLTFCASLMGIKP